MIRRNPVRTARRAASGMSLVLALGLAACGPIVEFGNSGPPPSLYALRSAAPEPVTPRALPSPLMVATPDPIAELRPPRIAVFTSLTGVSYLPDSRWIDPPSRLMARLLEERLREASSGVVLSPRQFEVGYDYRLNTRLVGFHVDATNGNHIARVALEAVLLRPGTAQSPAPGVVGTARFQAERPLRSVQPDHVTETLNAAANDVATQLIAWVAGLDTGAPRQPQPPVPPADATSPDTGGRPQAE